MNPVVIDASAGAEIVAGTSRGRALAGLVPAGVEGWVPEHFYAEILAVLRRHMPVEKLITEARPPELAATENSRSEVKHRTSA